MIKFSLFFEILWKSYVQNRSIIFASFFDEVLQAMKDCPTPILSALSTTMWIL